MDFRKSVIIDAPLDKVWKIAAQDFHKVELWASTVHSSKANEALSVPEGAEVGGRICATGMGDPKETFAHFDADDCRFTISFEGLPPFIRNAQNAWSLRAVGPDRTEVTNDVTMDFNTFPGRLLQPLMRGRLERNIDNLLEELQHFAETDTAHPRKAEAQKKVAAKSQSSVAS